MTTAQTLITVHIDPVLAEVWGVKDRIANEYKTVDNYVSYLRNKTNAPTKIVSANTTKVLRKQTEPA